MPEFEWVRRDPEGNEVERATTEKLEPPTKEGWYLVSKFGVKVKGGASPSRSSR